MQGLHNECVVASGLLYFDWENVTSADLGFRRAISEPKYSEGDHRGLDEVFGLRNDQATVQPAGNAAMADGRCLAFPNTLQCRTPRMSLVDGSRGGHCRVLVLLLVDPTVRVTSTLSVPPQQASWTVRQRQDELQEVLSVRDVQKLLLSYMDWPIEDGEAQRRRAELSEDREKLGIRHSPFHQSFTVNEDDE